MIRKTTLILLGLLLALAHSPPARAVTPVFEQTFEGLAGAGTFGPFDLPAPLPSRFVYQGQATFGTGAVTLQTSPDGTTWNNIGVLNNSTTYLIVNPNPGDSKARLVVSGNTTVVYVSLSTVADRDTRIRIFTPSGANTQDTPFSVDGGDYHVQMTTPTACNFNLTTYRWQAPPTPNTVGSSVIGGPKTGITSLDMHNVTIPLGLVVPRGLTAGCQYTVVLTPENAVPSGYQAPAVHFNGSTWAQVASVGVANTPLFTLSAWVKLTTDVGVPMYLMQNDPAGVGQFVYITGGSIQGYTQNATGTAHLGNFGHSTDWPFDTKWHHILVASRSNFAQGSKQLLVQVDGITTTGGLDDLGASFNGTWNGKSMQMPDNSGFTRASMDVADLCINIGYQAPDSTEYRDSVSGKPKDPAGFTHQCSWMLHGDATSFFSNALGSQSSNPFVIQAGSLTNAITSPSN